MRPSIASRRTPEPFWCLLPKILFFGSLLAVIWIRTRLKRSVTLSTKMPVPGATAVTRPQTEWPSASTSNILPVSNQRTTHPAPAAQSTAPHIYLYSGTHITGRQRLWSGGKRCTQLARSLLELWGTRNATHYASALGRVKESMHMVAAEKDRCHIDGYGKYAFTFPLSYRTYRGCSPETLSILARRLWLDPESTKGTMIDVSWFSQRPNLVHFARLASFLDIPVSIHITVGHDPSSAAIVKEGCPRLRSIMDVNGDTYLERYFLFLISDVQNQVRFIKRNLNIPVRVDVCSASELKGWSESIEEGTTRSSHPCFARSGLEFTAQDSSKSALATVTASPYFLNQKLKKSIFEGSTLVFIAGIEGSGHHLFSLLGRRHTTRKLYESFFNFVRYSAWGPQSRTRNFEARAAFVTMLRSLNQPSSNSYFGPVVGEVSKVFFLNTVFVEKEVNMFSYPFGGPACRMKSKARSICQIDLFGVAMMAQEAGIDFRIVWLTRSMGPSVVSTAVHRPLHRYTVPSAGFYMMTSHSLLTGALGMLDPAFTLRVKYEDMMTQPEVEAGRIVEHIRAPDGSELAAQIKKYLVKSSKEHPLPANRDAWKEEVTKDDLLFLNDTWYDYSSVVY